jgi:hypothetical protein
VCERTKADTISRGMVVHKTVPFVRVVRVMVCRMAGQRHNFPALIVTRLLDLVYRILPSLHDTDPTLLTTTMVPVLLQRTSYISASEDVVQIATAMASFSISSRLIFCTRHFGVPDLRTSTARRTSPPAPGDHALWGAVFQRCGLLPN